MKSSVAGRSAVRIELVSECDDENEICRIEQFFICLYDYHNLMYRVFRFLNQGNVVSVL